MCVQRTLRRASERFHRFTPEPFAATDLQVMGAVCHHSAFAQSLVSKPCGTRSVCGSKPSSEVLSFQFNLGHKR
jgi:hypothetical protein